MNVCHGALEVMKLRQVRRRDRMARSPSVPVPVTLLGVTLLGLLAVAILTLCGGPPTEAAVTQQWNFAVTRVLVNGFNGGATTVSPSTITVNGSGISPNVNVTYTSPVCDGTVTLSVTSFTGSQGTVSMTGTCGSNAVTGTG